LLISPYESAVLGESHCTQRLAFVHQEFAASEKRDGGSPLKLNPRPGREHAHTRSLPTRESTRHHGFSFRRQMRRRDAFIALPPGRTADTNFSTELPFCQGREAGRSADLQCKRRVSL